MGMMQNNNACIPNKECNNDVKVLADVDPTYALEQTQASSNEIIKEDYKEIKVDHEDEKHESHKENRLREKLMQRLNEKYKENKSNRAMKDNANEKKENQEPNFSEESADK